MFGLDHGPGRRAYGALVVVGAMIVAACGSSSDDDAATETVGVTAAEKTEVELNSEPSSVVSDDGMLTLDIPAGAMPEGTEVSVAPADEVPTELAVLGDHEGAYVLEPAGLEFSTPAEITLELEDVEAGTVPVVLGLLESDGEVEALPAQRLVQDESGTRLTASIEHFSTVSYYDGAVTMSVSPSGESFELQESWIAQLSLGSDGSLGFGAEARAYGFTSQSTNLELLPDDVLGDFDPEVVSGSERRTRAGFQCTSAGPATYRSSFDIWLTDSFLRAPEEDSELSAEAWKLLAIVADALKPDWYTGSITASVICLETTAAGDPPSQTNGDEIDGEAGESSKPETDGPGVHECELDVSDISRPSISETGRAGAAANAALTDGLDIRELGLAIVTAIDNGELCLEDLVTLVDTGTLTPEMATALATAAEVVRTGGG